MKLTLTTQIILKKENNNYTDLNQDKTCKIGFVVFIEVNNAQERVTCCFCRKKQEFKELIFYGNKNIIKSNKCYP
jgi:hypothetical protein